MRGRAGKASPPCLKKAGDSATARGQRSRAPQRDAATLTTLRASPNNDRDDQPRRGGNGHANRPDDVP
ncbi:hypothetical protein Acsp04_28320 [Actinomadura sp. NBRC 104425]|nr:hypothetical protein Acsp04_28320 [Actinomadura sp. NBRC 104425]